MDEYRAAHDDRDVLATEPLDPVATAPDASQWHRLAAGAVTAIVVIGGPVGALLIGIPTLLPFFELVFLVLPLLALSVTAWVLLRRATVTADGTRVTPGQLVTGLRPIAGTPRPRLVRVADLPSSFAPPRRRVIEGTIAFCLTAFVASVLVFGSTWLAYAVVTETQMAEDMAAEAAANEPQATMVKDDFVAAMLSSEPAAGEEEVIFIAVGTPSKKTGEADLTYVENVAREIALTMDSYKLIVEKSTVPADTGNRIARTIRLNIPQKHRTKSSSIAFDVASNPEFLREGSAIDDFMNPDRIVIGVQSKKAEKLLREIYKPLKARIVVTDINSAEIIKHASNSFLAMKISFANALSQICDRVGADVLKVAEGMGLDKRIGRAFLNAGIGYGGSCFPKDVDAFIRLSEKSGYDFKLLKEVRNINEHQKESFVKLIEDKLWIIKGKTIGVLGLAFKPNTDDMRNAPSLDIINTLKQEGAKIKVYDPQSMTNAKKFIKGIIFCKDVYSLAKGCDCLLLLTEWEQFKNLDFKRIKSLMQQPILFDGRNLYYEDNLEGLEFEYYSIGRGKIYVR